MIHGRKDTSRGLAANKVKTFWVGGFVGRGELGDPRGLSGSRRMGSSLLELNRFLGAYLMKGWGYSSYRLPTQ